MTIQGIVFDLGWTLLDFTGDALSMGPQRAADVGQFLRGRGFEVDRAGLFADYQAEMRVLREVGAELNYEYPARLAMLRALRRHLPRDVAAQLGRGAMAASFASVIPLWQPYTDAVPTLSSLRDAGYRLGCISNTNDGAYVQRMVDRYGLRPWLSPVLTSEEVGLRKPHPDIFWLLLNEWGVPPSEAVMVGDTLNADVLGAQEVGMRAVWVDRGDASPWSGNEESKAYILPDATISRLAQLPELLDGAWPEGGGDS